MDENSFGSCSSYFERLLNKACKIDNGIEKLSDVWKMPHLLVGGYGERPVEMDAHLEELRKSINSTNDAIEKFRLELKLSLEETDQVIDEVQTSYKDLKAECDDLDTVLAEYGYHYEEHKNNMSDNSLKNGNENCTDENILNSKELEVEFTPYLTWKCKAKYKESDISNSSQEKSTVTSIATPVIKSLASVSLSENSEAKHSLIHNTLTQKSSNMKHLTRILRK